MPGRFAPATRALAEVGEMGGVPFAVLTYHLPRDGNSGHKRVQGESQGRQARVAAHGGVDKLTLVLLCLGDETPGRPGERADGQRGHATAVDERRHLDDVVRVEEAEAGAVAGVDDDLAGAAPREPVDHLQG